MRSSGLTILALGFSAACCMSGVFAAEKTPAERDGELLKASADPALVRQGRDLYSALCQACHGEEKSKASLPSAPSNLFDAKWYHGAQPNQIERTILNGLLEKGMPPWKEALPAEDTTALAAYLLSFQKPDAATAKSTSPSATPAPTGIDPHRSSP